MFGISFMLWLKGYAQEFEEKSQISVGGYIKYLQSTSLFRLDSTELQTNNLIHNRINFKYFPNDHLSLSIEVRNRLLFGEQVKFFNSFLSGAGSSYGELVDIQNGLFDLSILWVDENAAVLHSVIDRAYLAWSKDKWDIRVGRQRINWGVNLAWNPNDLFNAFNYLDFDYEERPGSDAIRIQYFPGLLSAVELAVAPAKEIKQSIAAMLYRFNVAGYDWQILGAYSQEQLVGGMGWAGAIGGAGLKGEMSYFYELEKLSDQRSSLSASLTLDYQFSAVYASFAVLYNESANGQIGLQNSLTSEAPSPRNLFPSEWAILAQTSQQINPLSQISMAFIYGTDNNQLIAFPTITYSIAQNWDIDLVIQSFWDRSGTTFQHQSSSAFFRLKWSY